MSSGSKAGHSRGNRAKESKTKKSTKNITALDEHIALCNATDAILRKTITSDEHLADLPPDCTLEELQSEIALARGQATVVYVRREGLPSLKVVLPQRDPTIANLKRGIERVANLLQKRKKTTPAGGEDHKRATLTTKSSSDTPPRRAGDGGALIAVPRPGSNHRSRPSWRFLWRAYCLIDATDNIYSPTTKPLPDADGRQLLSDFCIGHKSVLRFVKRENYFGRQRQRS